MLVEGTGDLSRIEWIAVAQDGTISIVRFMETTKPSPTTEVSINTESETFVSFIRSGASPVTAAASELAATDRWTLPAARLGGEVVVVFAPAPVLPARLRFSGPDVRDVLRGGRLAVSMPGLMPGRYLSSPEYEGGIAGRAIPVTVAAGRTTFARAPVEPVGRVDIEADGGCDYFGEIGVNRLEPADGPRLPPERHGVIRLQKPWTCSGTIAGLAPGPYEAYVRGANGSMRTARVEVVEQTVVLAQIGDGVFRVSGQVTLNDRPFGGGRELRFSRAGEPAINAARAEIDAGGRYEVDLSETGEYRVHLYANRARIPGRSARLEVVEPETTFDWALEGGDLAVRLDGWARQQPIRVSLILAPVAADDPSIGGNSTGYTLSANGENPFVLPGVPLGEFKVWASSVGSARPYLSSAQETVTLSEDEPEAEVVLRLRESGLTVRLNDVTGSAVVGAHLSTSMRRDRPSQAIEVEPGLYSIERAIPGFSLYVLSPGRAPTCRIIPTTRDMDVVVIPGRPVPVRFSRPVRVQQAPGEVHGLPGSECPVPLSLFDAAAAIPSSEESDQLTVNNFTTAGNPVFVWRSTGERQPMVVGADGVIRIRLPERRDERR